MLGQGADAQLHGSQLVEVTDQLVGRDRDEAGRESALRHERLLGAGGDLAHRARDLDVFRQIEIMYTGAPRSFRDCDVAVVRQARDHGVDGMALEVRVERRRVGGVERVGTQIREAMSVDHCICSLAAHVCEMHFVRAGLGEQAGDERSDLAGAENENLGHADLRKRAPIVATPRNRAELCGPCHLVERFRGDPGRKPERDATVCIHL